MRLQPARGAVRDQHRDVVARRDGKGPDNVMPDRAEAARRRRHHRAGVIETVEQRHHAGIGHVGMHGDILGVIEVGPGVATLLVAELHVMHEGIEPRRRHIRVCGQVPSRIKQASATILLGDDLPAVCSHLRIGFRPCAAVAATDQSIKDPDRFRRCFHVQYTCLWAHQVMPHPGPSYAPCDPAALMARQAGKDQISGYQSRDPPGFPRMTWGLARHQRGWQIEGGGRSAVTPLCPATS